MYKLSVIVVLALFTNGIFGQQQQQSDSAEGDLEDRYGDFNGDRPNRFPGRRPNQFPFPGQQPNNFPFPGQQPNNFPFPGQQPNNFPFPGQQPNNFPFPGPGQFPNQRTTTLPPTTTPTAGGSTTQSTEISQCITSCPVTPEYNPVCGTDGVTYTNPGRLACAQDCGVTVNLLRTSPCPAVRT